MRLIAKKQKPLLILSSDSLLTYHYGAICVMNSHTGKFRKICYLQSGVLKRLLSRIRLIERLMRIEVRTAVKVSDSEILVSYNGSVYLINLKDGLVKKEYSFRNDMRAPLSIAKIQNVEGFEDCVAFGEYYPNVHRKNEIAVFIRSLTDCVWKQVFTFPAGKVRHIHDISVNQQQGKVYITTGDTGAESGIWEAKRGFEEVKPVVLGNQKYRCVHVFSRDDTLYYASDAPQYQNYIYCLKKSGKEAPELSILAKMSGSCIFATETKNYFLFSSTVEPDEKLPKLELMFSTKPAPGVMGKNVDIVAVEKRTGKVSTVCSFKKDSWPYYLFQYGNVAMIPIPGTDEVFIYPRSVKKYDGNIYQINVASESEN